MGQHAPDPETTSPRQAPAAPGERGDVDASGTPRPTGRVLLTVLRRTVLWVVLVGVALTGGLATTRLFPTSAQTEYFGADLSLSPFPGDASTVHVPTVLGDVDLDFGGALPAPGITAHVQVREEVTDLLALGAVSVDRFTPEPAELRDVVNGALVEIGWKFAAGALGTTAVCGALWVLGRRHRGWGRAAVASVTATGMALALPGAGAYLTYRADNLAEFRATSLLGTVAARSTLLSDINGQARQAAPYVQNILALSEALRQEYSPPEITDTAGARFLLISDVHGMDYYPLVREIIAAEDITAVIDTGDLVNFGNAREGDIAGIYEGIASLGVPYFFVLGNHDAAFRGDENVLRRMALVPNVVLLEPSRGEYVEAEIAGVRITGFNDYRHFDDPSDDFAADQLIILEEFVTATAGREPADIVMTHQPYSANRAETAGVTINGHMHTPSLSGHRIGVGSFTGGGLFNHFILPEDVGEETGGELPGQPYAFDILTVGQDCRVVSLNRYAYRNLVSGRPQYDDVSLINGSTIDPTPPEGRTCGGSGEVVVTPIVPVPDDAAPPGAPGEP